MTSERTVSSLPPLLDAVHNRETAFTNEERRRNGTLGLLPDAVETLDRQMERVLWQLDSKSNDLERFLHLNGLSQRNETLFFKVVMSDPKRFLPIVYDPTIADACLQYSRLFERPQGMYLSLRHKGHVKEVLANWPEKDVRFICVSSGGRILGLGDIGANGMGIPVGKLQLYTACAAIPPQGLMPMLLDIGTTNQELIDDPLYLGLRQAPPSSDELDSFVDELVSAVQELYPRCCLHFEDWKGDDAIRLLARYRDKILCYNDDIQGTAAITIAGLDTALSIKGEALQEQRILFYGAGSAGVGIANMIVSALQDAGLSETDARACISMMDINGLIEPSRQDLNPSQKVFAHSHAATKDLAEAVRTIKPTILIGVSTHAGGFTEEVVRTMASINDKPVIFALSNPTDKAECTAEQAYLWTEGRALFAAGVQFDDVTLNGKTLTPGQANNFYIFPAVALAVWATQARRITDEVFLEAAKATAEQVTMEQRAHGLLFPPQKDVLRVEINTAIKVARQIFKSGLAQVPEPEDIVDWIEAKLYRPEYSMLEKS
ncbi:NAD-dependent malic enzyme [Gluconobacter wancherniae]|uniref:NAD-dependent malic enzyme n=1 Tax=Gluconobacter wancherniae TaxID=1307955 RepID=UPI0030A92B5B